MSTVVLAGSCPDISQFRSENITSSSFDPGKLAGLWYEAAYIDPAQVGASCPTCTISYDAASGTLTCPFKVKYGPVPFTITEVYTPQNTSSLQGLYTKRVEAPGSKLAEFESVVVDAAFGQDNTTSYSTWTLYSCKNVVGGAITELQFFARDKNISDDDLGAMKSIARSLGVSWDDSKLKRAPPC